MENNIDWGKLREPLPEYKWKINNSNRPKTSVFCVPYFDARDLEDRLDNVLTPTGWQDDYKQVKNTMFCGIGIKIEDGWLWKWGAGVEVENYNNDDNIKLKGEASDALKLAGVKWGIFRDVYRMSGVWLNAENINNKAIPVDKHGKKIKDLTDYINNKMNAENQNKDEYSEEPDSKKPKYTSPEDLQLMIDDAHAQIDLALEKEKISEETGRIFHGDAKSAVSKDDINLIIKKLDLVDYYLRLRPHLTSKLKETYKNQILEVTIKEAKSLTKEFDRISRDMGLK